MSRPTPAQQRNAVSEGAALGVLLCGVDTLRYDKLAIDLSFLGAWRAWEHRTQFPQVSTDLKSMQGAQTLTRATESKQVWALYWRKEAGQLSIHPRQHDWHVEDPADVDFALEVLGVDVPRAGWIALAQDFLDRLRA